MRQNALATASPEDVVAFSKRLDDMVRQGSGAESAVESLLLELGAIKETLVRSSAGSELRDKARALELEVVALQLQLSGDEARDLAGDPGPVSVKQRLNVIRLGTSYSTYGGTEMHKRNLEIAAQGFSDIKTALERIFKTDMPALRQAMDNAAVPWTPGRGVPAGT